MVFPLYQGGYKYIPAWGDSRPSSSSLPWPINHVHPFNFTVTLGGLPWCFHSWGGWPWVASGGYVFISSLVQWKYHCPWSILCCLWATVLQYDLWPLHLIRLEIIPDKEGNILLHLPYKLQFFVLCNETDSRGLTDILPTILQPLPPLKYQLPGMQ